MDHEKMFPKANKNITDSFEKYSHKILNIVQENTKNETIKELLPTYNKASPNSKAAILIAGLHSILYSPKSITKGFKRLTMIDSINYMMLLTTTTNNIDILIEERRCQMVELKISLHPFIIIQGESYSNISDNIILVFDCVTYKFNSLTIALEHLLKLYAVLDLEWPKANSSVYSFLEHLLMKIKRKTPMESKVQQIIQLFDEECNLNE